MKTIPQNYLTINQQSWNNRLQTHLNSDFYEMSAFREGKNSLNPIEIELLGDIKGKSILHLQCHFGQDSLSLSRLGANVTGVDLSDQSINKAKDLAQELNLDTQFICSDIYDLKNHLDQKFDIVYTSYGTITWLPDLEKWAAIIANFLKPNGKFVFVEFHPVVWMFDDDFKDVGYNYFNDSAIQETENGTYADLSAEISQEYITWNHSLSEVMTSLLSQGFEIKHFQEYDYSPYNCFKHTTEFEPKKFRIKHLENKIPMLYSLVAQCKGV